MSYAQLRSLFERVQGLDRAAREALYAQAGVEAALRTEVEAMLEEPGTGDTISEVIGGAAREAIGATGMVLERIGPWRVLGLLGEGGMGTVWLGERADGAFERKVAIKLIRGHVTEHSRERFRRERQLLAGLDHPNIAALIDGGTTAEGEPYLVMAHVEGEPLLAWLDHTQPRLDARLRLFASLCRAVAHAHQHLVVHRDIKPSNIMVRSDGEPVLLDFGIAKLLESGPDDGATASRVMTPAWASPEQLLGRPVTTATDVYGLGLVLYALLAGAVPERGDVARAASVELPPPSRLAAAASLPLLRAESRRVRGDLDKIARRAVRTDPEARYPSALALVADVEAWLAGRPVTAAGTHATYLFSRFVRRHRVATAAVTAALGLSVVFAVNLVHQRDRALDAEARATREAEVANQTSQYLVELFSELDPDLHPGRPLSARELLDLGRDRLANLAATQSAPVRTRLQRSLGWIYVNAGQPATAVELLEAAGEAGMDDASPLELVRADTALARAYYLLGRYEASHEVASRALDVASTLVPRDDRLIGHTHMGRGVAQQSLARFDQAEASFAAARVHFEAAGAEVDVASVLHNQGWLKEQRGEYAAALAIYDEAYARKLASLGVDHPKTLVTLHGRSKCLAGLGRTDEAIAVLEDLLARTVRVFGRDSDPVQNALSELGSALQDAGRYVEAQASYERSLEVLANLGSSDSAGTAVVINNLASLLEDRGDLSGAEAQFRRSRELRRRLMPAGHPGRAVPAHNLARLLLTLERHDEAEAMVAEAHALRTTALPAGHPLRVQTGLLRAQIALERGQRDEARDRLAPVDAEIAGNAALPDTLRSTARQLRDQIEGRQQDPGSRLERRRALEAGTGALPAAHPKRALQQLALAEALLEVGERAEARRLVAAAAPALRAQLVPQAPALARLDRLEQTLRN